MEHLRDMWQRGDIVGDPLKSSGVRGIILGDLLGGSGGTEAAAGNEAATGKETAAKNASKV